MSLPQKRKRPSSTVKPPTKKPVDPRKGYSPDNPMRLYADGVFDMFHHGHMRLLKNCKKQFPYTYLIVGVSGNEDTYKFKGKTVMNESERAEAVDHCKWVDEVICPCPWVITLEFVEEHGIDFVCHDDAPYGSAGSEDIYAGIKAAGRFLATQRTEGISTSDIILRIIRDYDDFIRRNLARGYTRQELNVSFTRAQRMRIKQNWNELKNSWNDWTHNENPRDGPIKKTMKGIVKLIDKWSHKSEEFITKFIGSFDRVSQG